MLMPSGDADPTKAQAPDKAAGTDVCNSEDENSRRAVPSGSSLARIFLLSPANLAGKRAKILLNPDAQFPAAQNVRDGRAELGDTFAFLSGLYFRGKLAYARAFARPLIDVNGSWVITSNRGLLDVSTRVNVPLLHSLAQTPIDPTNVEYRAPLQEAANRLRKQISEETEIVLLGSIATAKYVEPLLEIFGNRMMFPSEFVGRGDMSRGALLLRSVASRTELAYSVLQDAVRSSARATGRRPVRPSG